MKNINVVEAFLSGQSAHTANLTSTGKILYSYAAPIAYNLPSGAIAINTDYYKYSVTTTRHIGYVRREAPTNRILECSFGMEGIA